MSQGRIDEINVNKISAAIGNDGYGMRVTMETINNVTLYAEHNVITDNADSGLIIKTIDATSSSLVLRNNSIYDNSSYDVDNIGATGDVDAEYNWWGQDPPDAGQFNGSVDYDPWLNYDPNL